MDDDNVVVDNIDDDDVVVDNINNGGGADVDDDVNCFDSVEGNDKVWCWRWW